MCHSNCVTEKRRNPSQMTSSLSRISTAAYTSKAEELCIRLVGQLNLIKSINYSESTK